MSNPLVNRWGSNTYWTSLWYSDMFYSANVQHDSAIVELLKIYFFYGLQTPKNIFFRKYWYLSKRSFRTPQHVNFSNKYFRTYAHKIYWDETPDSYKTRTRTRDIYPLKTWIFKCHNWVLINFYWYKPMKGLKGPIYKNTPKTFNFFSVLEKNNLSSLRRYKIFITKNLYKIFYKRFLYKF